MTPVKVLRKAKGLLEKRGLAKGTYENYRGALCMLAACGVAEYGRPGDPSSDVISLLKQATNPKAVYLHTWNDAKSRTKKQVLAAFDRAIAIAESQQ